MRSGAAVNRLIIPVISLVIEQDAVSNSVNVEPAMVNPVMKEPKKVSPVSLAAQLVVECAFYCSWIPSKKYYLFVVTSTGSIFASIRQSKAIEFSHPAFSNICIKQTPMTAAPGCLSITDFYLLRLHRHVGHGEPAHDDHWLWVSGSTVQRGPACQHPRHD